MRDDTVSMPALVQVPALRGAVVLSFPLVNRIRVAVALLNPITWPKPFGLVMAKALATATPVLAFPHGAAPEIIDHGRTGYLCRYEDEMTDAVSHIDEIDRAQCRAADEQR